MSLRGIVRTGEDTAGGIIRPLQTKCKLRGNPVGVIGSPVDSHPPCPIPAVHCTAVMAEGLSKHRIIQGGVTYYVCLEGHLASCGHAATGRPYFRVAA